MGHAATIIGIDHGNNMIKTAHCAFSSHIISHGTQPPSETQEYLFWNGTYYIIDNTSHAGFVPNKANAIETNDDYFKLTLMAIACELNHTKSYIRAATEDNPMLIELALGLPPLHVSAYKDEYISYFAWGNETISFMYGKNTYHIRIVNVNVFPQGIAASCINDEKVIEFRKRFSSYYIIDIGGYTMDCMLVGENKVEHAKCETLHIGVNNLVNRIQKEFTRLYSSPGVESVIIKELRGIRTGLPEVRRKTILEQRDDYARFICAELNDKGFNTEELPCLFVGGGSLLFEESLRKISKINENSIFVNNVHANAIGYQLMTRLAKMREAEVSAL